MQSEDDERCQCRCHAPTSIFGVKLVDDLEAAIACTDCSPAHVEARLGIKPPEIPTDEPFDPDKEY